MAGRLVNQAASRAISAPEQTHAPSQKHRRRRSQQACFDAFLTRRRRPGFESSYHPIRSRHFVYATSFMPQPQTSRVFYLLLVLIAAGFVSGCRTYNQQGEKILQAYRHGDLIVAEQEATKKADDKMGGKDAIIWRLEQAAILRSAAKIETSNRAFDQAQERIDGYAQAAKIKLASEAGALLSNQANLPYRGRAYDGIMLNTYKALNYLQLGAPDRARVELIRARQRQQEAVEDNKKRIEKTQEEVEELQAKDQRAIEAARENSQFKAQMESNFGGLDKLAAFGDYENPFTVYLDGLFFMATATGNSDLENARFSLKRVSGFAPDNKFLKADLEAIEGVLRGRPIPPTTYVIFETGCAPIRDQIRIDIPILVASVSYVGAAFPKLVNQGDFMPSLTVTANGKTETTAMVCSMDSVIGRDFKNELPTIVTKTLASTVTKATAAYFANEATRKADDTAGAVMKLATAAYQAAVNIADCRTWNTLPKEFQVCRILTPPDRRIELFGSTSGQRMIVTVGEGVFNIVYVKAINGPGPLRVSQFKLK
jgi:hypothetical protein